MAAAVVYIIAFGVPTDTAGLMAWIIAALCIVAMATPNHRVIRVFLDWLPFAIVLIAWNWSRGLAVRLGRPVHVTPPIEIDKFLGFGHVPTIWLQKTFGIQDGKTYVWEIVPTLIYVTHFIAAPVLAAVLWVKNRRLWLAFVKRFLSLMIAGVITYVLVPWAPPWRAATFGKLPPIHRSVSDGWQYLHLRVAADVMSVGQAGVNLDAAMPSLHAGLSFLIVLFLWRHVRTLGRIVLVAYALGMAFTLVLGGEHYVNDIIAGWAFAIVVHLVWNRLDRRRSSNTKRRPATRRPGARDPSGAASPGPPDAVRPAETGDRDPVLD